MSAAVFGSWELTTEHAASSYGQPVLINRATQEAFGPGDIVRAYPSWGFMAAAEAVKRMAATANLDEDGQDAVTRFCGLTA